MAEGPKACLIPFNSETTLNLSTPDDYDTEHGYRLTQVMPVLCSRLIVDRANRLNFGRWIVYGVLDAFIPLSAKRIGSLFCTDQGGISVAVLGTKSEAINVLAIDTQNMKQQVISTSADQVVMFNVV